MKLIWILAILILAGCSYPKDPENSYANARMASLKVGVAVNPPYTTFENGKAGGKEIEMLRKLAGSGGLKITFQEGSESELIEKLKNYELHILAGGFRKKTIWEKDAGTTMSYDEEHIFLIPKGENRLLQKLETFIFHYLETHERDKGL